MPFDGAGNRERVASLSRRGVDVWGAERVYVSPDVDLDRIQAGAQIQQATLSGPDLTIAAGARIGVSGHAEVNNCQIGRDVELGAGLFRGATFLRGAKVRGFAEIRQGTLLEEEAEAAHSAALKNTVFTACCVAGSLVNFCDLFLSGGTSRHDHTEVGSGAIHFNFDPRGDKWGSLIGGIRGVLLRSDPIFIGGNCGLVGPLEIGFGTVTAAGSVIRKDVGEGVVVATAGKALQRGFDRRSYGSLTRQFQLAAKLIGTLRALDAWYGAVRIPHAASDDLPLYGAARRQIDIQIRERISRLGRVVSKLPESVRLATERGAANSDSVLAEHRSLIEKWDSLRRVLEAQVPRGTLPKSFLDAYARARIEGTDHLDAVRSAQDGIDEVASWLDGMVGTVSDSAGEALGVANL